MNDIASLTSIVQVVERIGIVGLLLFIILAGFKRWVVFGYQLEDERSAHQKTRDDRDQWMRLALGNMNLADRAVQHAANLQGVPTTKAS